MTNTVGCQASLPWHCFIAQTGIKLHIDFAIHVTPMNKIQVIREDKLGAEATCGCHN